MSVLASGTFSAGEHRVPAELELLVDIAATAPRGALELTIAGPGIHAADVNTGRTVTAVAETGTELLILSGLGALRRQFVSVPLQSIRAGEYTLDIEVRDLLTGAPATGSSRFRRD